ncbi:unnamed protein product [Parnassius apollo]|uniref:beta-glucosidase n=1 Tax=Parnassius apollo TaxID=110799 RepID=A0A8S3Y9Y1_PARAO|nr:unnamed protein product [Parnassius apollo]
MSTLQAVVLWVLLICADLSAGVKFPPGFLFGAATASYQVEGAWNVSDKGENVWDRLVHSNPDAIKNRANGDVACDSYHNWRDDVKIASNLGLHFYRFSISWSRLLPTGLPDRISEDGKNYYNNLIDALLEKGVQPVITLYHWDLPQRLQDLGGWTNPLIVEWFADYARVAYTLYADRVKAWITINEPIIVCDLVYNSGLLAPPIKDPGFANYLCTKFLLLAHAKAWRIYDEEFKPKYNGKVSITNQIVWMEPVSGEYEELTENLRHYMAGMYSHPIYTKDGGWPPEIEKIIAENSKREGYPRSRLPAFTQDEIDFIKGTYDFYGFNFYTSRLVRKARDGETISNWPLGNGCPELDAALEVDPSWDKAVSAWFWINPVGIRKMLGWLKKTYGDIEIFILENGVSSKGYNLNDEERIKYYRDHLKQVWLAITEDGVNVTRYTAWTLVDNFEWFDGYTTKFGLYEVDFEDPKRKRTPRASAKYYKEVIRTHSFDVANKNYFDEL